MAGSWPPAQRLTREVDSCSALSASEAAKSELALLEGVARLGDEPARRIGIFPAVGAQPAIVDLGQVLLRPAQHVLDLPGRLRVVGRLAGAQQRRGPAWRPARRPRRAPVAVLDRRLGGGVGRPVARRPRRRPLHGGRRAPRRPVAAARSGTTTGPTIRGGTLGTARGTGAGAAAITFFVHPVASAKRGQHDGSRPARARRGHPEEGTRSSAAARRAGHVSSDVRQPGAAGS